MDRTSHVSRSFEDADRWDREQQLAMTPDQRLEVAHALRERIFDAGLPDVRQAEWARRAERAQRFRRTDGAPRKAAPAVQINPDPRATTRSMDRTSHVARSFEEAGRWDREQQLAMTPDQRLEVAHVLRERAYGTPAPDVREFQWARRSRRDDS